MKYNILIKLFNYSIIQLSIYLNQMNNIHIALVGHVSVGKSTLLNALLLKNYSEMKKTRTTMQPIIFEEQSDNVLTNPDEYIIKTIQDLNIKSDKYILTETKFKIPKNSYFIENKNLTLYDIPGINDQQHKIHYEKYLIDNFKNFNIIFFVLNIEAGMNTKETIDLLELLCANIKKSSKHIYTLVIANKCDDIQIINDEISEVGLLFNEIKTITIQKFVEYGIKNNLIDIIPFNAIDAYLYRMIKINNNYILSKNDKNKIGVTKNGKLFNNNSEEDQNKIIDEIIKDNAYIDKIIEMSGFNIFHNTVTNFLTDSVYNRFKIDNLIESIDMSLEKILLTYWNGDKLMFDKLDKLLLALETYEKVNKQIKEIDENEHKLFVQIYIIDILDKVFNNIIKVDNIYEFEKIKKKINNILEKSFLKDIYKIEYQPYILEKILLIIKYRLNPRLKTKGKKIVKIHPLEIINYLLLFFTTDKEYISKLFTILNELPNVENILTEQFTYDQKKTIIKILNSLENIVSSNKLIFFARFIIVNEILLDINFNRQMFYKVNHCIILYKLCKLCSQDHSNEDMKKKCVNLLLKNINDYDNLLLDFYYLKYLCKSEIKEYYELHEKIETILTENIVYSYNISYFKNYNEEDILSEESDKNKELEESESELEKESESESEDDDNNESVNTSEENEKSNENKNIKIKSKVNSDNFSKKISKNTKSK